MALVPQIIAHRGASHDAPENTLSAIELGWSQLADAAEIDVHLTLDGEVVALHDRSLKRTTRCEKNVDELTLAELRELDAGSWKGASFAGEKIPSLAEILISVPPGKRLVIELKSGAEIVPALKRVLEAGDVSLARIDLIAFDRFTLRAAKIALPGATALFLASGKCGNNTQRTTADLDALITQARAAGFDGLNLGADWLIDALFVKRVHDAGLTLHVWTVNDPAHARRLAEAGVDGITTDRPSLIRAALKSARAT